MGKKFVKNAQRVKIMSKRKFTKEQEIEICNDYFSEKKPGVVFLGKKWNCDSMTICNIIKRNGFSLRTHAESLDGKLGYWSGKVRSDTTKEKMSISAKGKHYYWLGKTGPNLGKLKSEETKQKISDSLTGQKRSEETKEKMSKAAEERWKNPEYRKNHEGENNPMFGVHRFGEEAPNYGNTYSEETKRKISEKALQRYQYNLGPWKNTKPEIKMKEILNELTISFEHQFRLGNHLYDFHISNTNILIEVDGDYYHGNPEIFDDLTENQLIQKLKDAQNTRLAKTNNFVLLRFWQNDIMNNTEKVKRIIFSKFLINFL